MARKPIQEHPDFIELQKENDKLRRLLDDSVRFIFLVGPALSPLVGELGMMKETTDLQGVTLMNTHVTVTLRPSAEEILFQGVGTTHRLAITATEGKITAEQSKEIAFLMFAIKEVRRRKPDPMLLGGIDVFAHEVMTGV
jgi:hypothetical protein